MWYRLSRRESDYCVECREDGVNFRQMWICHLWGGNSEITFGIYACSPEASSFRAVFQLDGNHRMQVESPSIRKRIMSIT